MSVPSLLTEITLGGTLKRTQPLVTLANVGCDSCLMVDRFGAGSIQKRSRSCIDLELGLDVAGYAND